jgi:hypothetical protein
LCARGFPCAVALLAGLGADEVIADRGALAVGDQHQAHAPYEQALGWAVAVAGVPGELALALAAGIVRARDQRAVDQPDVALGQPLGDAQLNRGDPRSQPSEPAVVLRLVGQVRKPARQQPVDHAEKLTVRADPGCGLGDCERNQLVIADQPLRAGPRDRDRRGEHVGCHDEGLQRSGHLVLQSRAGRAGDPLLYVNAAACLAAQPTSSLVSVDAVKPASATCVFADIAGLHRADRGTWRRRSLQRSSPISARPCERSCRRAGGPR